MPISDDELDLFKDWQPGDSITIDANSVGMLIQEVIQSRATIRAWSDLDDERSNCEECEGQMIHVSEIGEVTEERIKEMASVPPNPTLKFDHFSIPKYNRDNAIATVTARITDEIRSILSNTKGESVSGQDVKQTPEIIKSGKNFYYCSECKNASNKPEGIPHSQTCSLPDLCKKP
jgi:hypothetical protein